MTDDTPAPPPAPRAEARPHTSTVHGRAITDDFAWIKAANWQEVLKDPAVLPADIRAYLEAENAYAAHLMAPLAGLEATLVAEMRGRIKEDDSTVPQRDGAYAYGIRYRTGGQHPLVYRRPSGASGEADDLVLLDGDALAQGHAFFEIGDHRHTDDHRLLAWSFDDAGSEYYTIRVRDTATLQDLPDLIEDTDGEFVWDKAGRSFLYVEMDDNHRPRVVRRHVLGTPVEDDALVYEEGDDGWFVNISQSSSGDFAFISISDHETTEVHVMDRADLSRPPRLLAAREDGVRYEAEHWDGGFVLLTNAGGAEDFKIAVAPLDASGRGAWRDLVPHRPGTIVLSLIAFRDWLVRLERENALPRLVVRSRATGEEHSVAFAEEAYALRGIEGYEHATDTLRFAYSSMTTPAETFDYDMRTRERRLLKRQEVPSGHDPARYVARRLIAVSHDGAEVPVSVLHRRDMPLDGTAPCLLYAYGAYGHALSAGFDLRTLSLVDRGFVYAVAHVRGGTEKGWAWYTSGKREKKPNTFKDFIAAGEMLAEKGYTARGRIAAQGRSAGGMLMGAIANLAPDLFCAVLAEVPFVDVLQTMLDGDLPLTPPEWPEWGNPGASEADFETIRAYSPVDCVSAQAYPAILAIGGLTDPRVTYWEPAKWIATLRARATGGGPFVLRIDMDSGHGGASGRFDRLKEVAQSYAFAIAAAEGRLTA
ncbi:S9 family peptidase [Alsobacter sp. R-9]